MNNLRFALSKTFRSFRDHLLMDLLLLLVVLALSWPASRQLHSQGHALASALTTAIYFGAGCALVFLGMLGFNWLRADLAREVIRLAPGEDAVAAERERVRTLAGCVGELQSEVRDKRAELERMRSAGHYWDPDREEFHLPKFKQSGHLLATDSCTRHAYQAVSDLRREMVRVSLIASNRWNEWASDQELNPSFQIYMPPVKGDDNLDSVASAFGRADVELGKAVRALERQG